MLAFLSNIFNLFIETIDKIKPLILFYSSWIFIHYICSQLYIYFCVPANIIGIFISPFMSMTPHCSAFRWIIYESGNIFYGMWFALGTWIVVNILTNK